MSGKMRPPTAQCGSTKASCRLGTPTVIVSVLASVRAPAVVAAPVAAVVVAPPAAAVVVAPPLAAVVVAPPPAVVVEELLLSPPHAASRVPSAARPVVASSERRENPN